MDRCEDRKSEMIMLQKYILDIDEFHMDLLNVLSNNRMDRDLVKIEFVDILDTIMGTAYKLFTGDIRENTLDELYKGIVLEYFNGINNDNTLNYIFSRIEHILNKYLLYLITIGISINRVLFIDNVNKKGIYVTEYDVAYLRT